MHPVMVCCKWQMGQRKHFITQVHAPSEAGRALHLTRRYMLWFQFKPAVEEALSANDFAMLAVFGEPPEQTARWKADLSRPGEHVIRQGLDSN